MKIKYRKLRGSNQYADIVRVEHDTLTMRGWVTLAIFSSLTMYLVTSYLIFVAGNVRRVALRDIATLTTMTVDAFQFHTDDSGYYSPITRAWAQELINQKPPVPEKTAKELIFSMKHSDIIWRIYGLESSFGKNDGCLNQGLYNGFGYRQNSSEWMCYKSFGEVVGHVENWLEQHEDMQLGAQLCLYNQGKPNLKCDYNNNFLSL